jgi:hypothetical protein
VRRFIAVLAVMGLVLAACGSGPSPAALERNIAPSTTTTTEPPPEGVVIVRIENGRFAPSNLEIDLDETWLVQWHHLDEPITNQDGSVVERVYQIISRDRNDDGSFLFESPELNFGDVYEVDFREFDPDLYRYNTFLGMQRIPGLVDTRPSR